MSSFPFRVASGDDIYAATRQGRLVEFLETRVPRELWYSNYHGDTILHYAARYNDPAAAKLLLLSSPNKEYVNSVNGFGRFPLHCAAQEGHLLVVKMLVASGARLDHQEELPKHITSALDIAISKQRDQVAAFLLSIGAHLPKEHSGLDAIIGLMQLKCKVHRITAIILLVTKRRQHYGYVSKAKHSLAKYDRFVISEICKEIWSMRNKF